MFVYIPYSNVPPVSASQTSHGTTDWAWSKLAGFDRDMSDYSCVVSNAENYKKNENSKHKN